MLKQERLIKFYNYDEILNNKKVMNEKINF